jgi:hypothetical protein
MRTEKNVAYYKGRPIVFDSVQIEGKTFVSKGKYIKIVSLKHEWFNDINDPEDIIKQLSRSEICPDIFTFIQRLPEINPKFSYFFIPEKVTAIKFNSYKDWFEKKITKETRKKTKRAEKRGVEIKIEKFSDDLIIGIMSVFNESPIRQGKPFWHYGKDFNTIKKEMSLDLDKSDFIAAYYEGSMIGVVKIIFAGEIATPGIIVTKVSHNDKYVANALMSKVIELCAFKNIQYVTYGPWWRGSMAEYLRRNGFEKMIVPRYFIPLTKKGKIYLKLKLYLSIKDILPEKLIKILLAIRSKWYSKKYKVDNES